MLKYLVNSALALATLTFLFGSTSEAQAQKKGGGNRSTRAPANVTREPVNVYRGPGYNYGASSWYAPSWNWGSGYYPNWGYSYGYPYRSYYGYSPYYYRDYSYPRSYYYSSYPTYDTYETYPSTVYPSASYESNYSTVQSTSTARITVRVPDPNAEVWFNGVATQQRGTDRLFETPALSGGYRHSYEIRARWMGADGQMMDRTQTIDVQPGQDLVVNF